MAKGSLRWAELFPAVRVRPFARTVPYGRRLLLARDRALERGVPATAMRCVERWYANATGGAQTGSVSVTQRFGSSLRLNLHFHVLFLDGGYVRAGEGGVRFRPARVHPSDVEALIVEIATACEAGLARHGHGRQEEEDRDGLLRLGRTLLRPPLAVDRLEAEADGRVRFTMKRTFEDGSAAPSFTAEELASRLVALIPPPHANTIVYRTPKASRRERWRALRARPAASRPANAARPREADDKPAVRAVLASLRRSAYAPRGPPGPAP